MEGDVSPSDIISPTVMTFTAPTAPNCIRLVRAETRGIWKRRVDIPGRVLRNYTERFPIGTVQLSPRFLLCFPGKTEQFRDRHSFRIVSQYACPAPRTTRGNGARPRIRPRRHEEVHRFAASSLDALCDLSRRPTCRPLRQPIEIDVYGERPMVAIWLGNY